MALKKLSDFPDRSDLNPTPPLETIRLADTMGTGTTTHYPYQSKPTTIKI